MGKGIIIFIKVYFVNNEDTIHTTPDKVVSSYKNIHIGFNKKYIDYIYWVLTSQKIKMKENN